MTITANTGIRDLYFTGIYQFLNSHQECCPPAYPLRLVTEIQGGFQSITVTFMFLHCLCQILTFEPAFIFKVQHQFKNQFKNRLTSFYSINSLCLFRETPGNKPLFCPKISYIDIYNVTKSTMQIISVFSLCSLLYLVTIGLKFITRLSQVGQSFLVCCSPREQTPCFSQLFPGSNSTNAETQENPGKHLLTGEEKGRAGYALLVLI